MNAKTHRRAGLVCVAFALVLSVYSGRLIYLQVGKHREYAALAAGNTAKKKKVLAERGAITDARGEVLAGNVPIYTVVVDATLVSDKPRLASILAPRLKLDADQLEQRIGAIPAKPYIVVARGVDAATKDAIEQDVASAKLRGMIYAREPRREYPNENMLGHVLGFLNREGKGVQGIEMMMEPYLKGEDGFIYTEKDAVGREIVAYRSMERPARDGMTVQLTIDMRLQAIVEDELEKACQMLNPKMMSAVFVDPSTGEILAMATRPSFNPNDPGGAAVETTRNRAIVDTYEPGSTFKLVIVSAALAEGLVTPSTVMRCENGSFAYGGKVLHDTHPYPELSVHDVLVKSSNIGCAKLGLLLGADKLYEYIRRFGFGERTGVGLPGEIGGILRPRHQWSALSLTRIPIGQGVAVTPLQSAMALSVIANGGTMMLPQIVRSVRDGDGREVVSFRPQEVRRVIAPETAAAVASALGDVVSDRGTARLASFPGYKVAGKTGTAEKFDPKGGYQKGVYVLSFAGYFPASNPRVAGIVVVDDPATPGTSVYGGTVVAPIFSHIGERMARELGLERDEPATGGATVALVPMEDAR